MKTKLLIAIGFALLTVSYIGFVYGGWTFTPYKETKASSPDFDPYKFKFEDYQGPDELYDNLPFILKSGIPMAEVDNILVKSGHAAKLYIGQLKNENKYAYRYSPSYHKYRFGMNDGLTWSVYITYDEQNNLQDYLLRAN